MELRRPPRLGPLYRGAVVSAIRRGRGGRGGRGDALPDTELLLRATTVDRAHLAEYDRVCGFRLTDELPATYPHVLAFPLAVAVMARPGFPLPLVGLVHVANRIEVHRPLRADERLTIRVRAADLRPHPRGRQVDLVAEVRDDGDEVVWVGRSTYLRRGGAAGPSRDGRQGARPPGEPDGSGSRPAPPHPSALWRVGAGVGGAYAAVSGDHNPIHTSRLGARLFGFPRPIAHGMWSLARCLAALEGRLPAAGTVDVAFKLPILLPARVAFSATGGDLWRIALHDAATGRPHLSGEVT